jgi:hypothetical protein
VYREVPGVQVAVPVQVHHLVEEDKIRQQDSFVLIKTLNAMKRYLILFTIIFLVPFFNQAQDMVDALRYSQLQFEGTARSGAMGNAFGALGGDFTSVTINPAGIGLYRSGEFAVTPKSSQINVESSYWNRNVDESNYKFTLSNISYVSTLNTKNTSEVGLVSISFGLGYNRYGW